MSGDAFLEKNIDWTTNMLKNWINELPTNLTLNMLNNIYVLRSYVFKYQDPGEFLDSFIQEYRDRFRYINLERNRTIKGTLYEI